MARTMVVTIKAILVFNNASALALNTVIKSYAQTQSCTIHEVW